MESLLFWITVTALIFYAFSQNHIASRSTSLPEENPDWNWWDEYFGGDKPPEDDDDEYR